MIRPVQIQIPLKMFLYGYFVIAFMIFHHTHQTEFKVIGTVAEDTNSEPKVELYFGKLLGLSGKNGQIQKNNPHLAIGPAIGAGFNKAYGKRLPSSGIKESRCIFWNIAVQSFGTHISIYKLIG
ncbi:unnamed protein product, partial [Leptidea sinapis]